MFSNWWKGSKWLPTRSVFTVSCSPTNKNNVFTQLNSRNHLPIYKTYCFLKWAIIFHLGTWLCTPQILALHAICELVLMVSMHSRSFRNGGFACHALRTLWVRWMRMFIITLPWLYDHISDSEEQVISPSHSFTVEQSCLPPWLN